MKGCYWAIGAMLLLASCADNSQYTHAIPMDAAMVSTIDLKTLSRKSGMDDNMNVSTQAFVKRTLGDDFGASGKILDRLVDNPLETGLGLTDKVYLFMSPEADYTGMLFRLDKRSELEEVIEALRQQQLCDKVRQSDGSSWTVMGKYLLAWSDHALIALHSSKGDDPSRLQRKADRLLRQEKAESFSATHEYDQMQQMTGDIVLLGGMNVLPYQYVLPYTMGVSADLKLKDIKALAGIRFEDGKATLDIKTLIADQTVGGVWKRFLEAIKPLEGKTLKDFPKNMAVWLAVNMNGKKLFELLNENPYVQRRIQHSMIPIDFKAIFDAIKGEVAIAMPKLEASKAFIAYAEVQNLDFLQTFEDVKSMLAMTGGQARLASTEDNKYEFYTSDASLIGLKPGPMHLWFGVTQGRFYITNDRRLMDRKVLGLSLENTSWGERVKGQQLFGAVALENLLPIADHITVESTDGYTLHLECNMKDKKENILRQLIRKFLGV